MDDRKIKHQFEPFIDTRFFGVRIRFETPLIPALLFAVGVLVVLFLLKVV